MDDASLTPFRRMFDNARTPYDARNALGPFGTIDIADNAITSAKIADGAVANVDLANMAQATVKGRASGAGTGVPIDLTATETGTIIAPAWAAFTPTLTAGTGTFTTASASGRYVQIGKLVFFTIEVSITTNGTAASYIVVTLPVTAQSAKFMFVGRDNALATRIIAFTSDTTHIIMQDMVTSGYPGANGALIDISGSYEAA